MLEENGRPVEAARGFGRDAEEGEDVAVGRLGVVLFARVAPTLHNLRKVHPKEGRVGSTPLPVWLWGTYNDSGERRHYNEGSPWPPRHHFEQICFAVLGPCGENIGKVLGAKARPPHTVRRKNRLAHQVWANR